MIDRDKYRALFAEEAREHLIVLDQGLVVLEDTPDAATLDRLFRAAHSLKGAAGTLGYDDVAVLSHALEDGLTAIRDRPADAEVLVAVLLPAADALGDAVDDIEAGGEPAGLDDHTATIRTTLDTLTVTSGPAAEGGRRGTHEDGAGNGRGDGRGDGHADGGRHGDDLDRDATAGPETADDDRTDRPTAPDDDRTTATTTTAAGDGATLRTGSTVRVPVERIDRLVDLMGELRITGSRLDDVLGEVLDEERPYNLQETLRNLTVGMRTLYDDVLEIRTMPVALLLDRIPRMVRDLCHDLGKEVDVVLEGRETTVDRSVIESLGDPLMHLVRNALDHGIEDPDARRAAGKTPHGTLSVRIARDTGGITVTVEDDGRGIDVDAVRRRAVERRLITADEAALLHPDDVLRLTTAPGFSTADRVTEVSGRGVGLDVVKHAVERVGGSLRLRGRPDGGTSVTMRLPPSLAVLDALTVKVDDETYYLPVDSVVTSLVLSAEDRARGRLVPPEATPDDATDDRMEGPARLLWSHADGPGMAGGAVADAPIQVVTLSDLLGVRGRTRYRGSSVARSEGLRKVEAHAASRRHAKDRHAPRTATPSDGPLSETRTTADASVGVVVKRHGQRLCLLVDAIGTLREVVVKSIESPGPPARHVSGATIDADGTVALILDVASLLDAAVRP